MEAGDSLNMEPGEGYQVQGSAYGSCVTPKLVKWKGDWPMFKKLFKGCSSQRWRKRGN